MLASLSHLPQRGCHAAFGWVMHGGDAASLHGNLGVLQHADAWRKKIIPGCMNFLRGEMTLECRRKFTRQQSCGFDWHPFGQNQNIPWLSLVRGYQLFALNF